MDTLSSLEFEISLSSHGYEKNTSLVESPAETPHKKTRYSIIGFTPLKPCIIGFTPFKPYIIGFTPFKPYIIGFTSFKPYIIGVDPFKHSIVN